jgi:CrcB protein
MKECLLVAIGGMFGSLARYLTGVFIMHSYPGLKFPLATFTVNLLGCLLIGLMAGLLEKVSFYNAELRLMLIVGFLGGFTTFSAFAIESLHLIKTGNFLTAGLYLSGSVIVGIFAALLGMKISLYF